MNDSITDDREIGSRLPQSPANPPQESIKFAYSEEGGGVPNRSWQNSSPRQTTEESREFLVI